MSKHPYLAGAAPRLLAHRGLVSNDEATAGVAENSFAAVANAHAAGATYVESDCHLTADGEVVLFHDDTLLRVTEDPRPIADVTYRELSDLMSTRGGLVTLRQALESFPDVRFNIDIKAADAALPAADIIARHANRVLVTSFGDDRRLAALARLDALGARPATSPGRTQMAKILLAAALGIRPWQKRLFAAVDALQIPERLGPLPVLTKRLLKAAHRQDVEIHVWTVNDPAAMRRLLDFGVDGLVTDRIDIALTLAD